MSQFPDSASHVSPKRGSGCKTCRCREQSLQPHRSRVEEAHTSSTGATVFPASPPKRRRSSVPRGASCPTPDHRSGREQSASRVPSHSLPPPKRRRKMKRRVQASHGTPPKRRPVKRSAGAPPQSAQPPKRPSRPRWSGCASPERLHHHRSGWRQHTQA